ncbi:hypothetical protein O181_057192 [Austropuccinia psidii MF-1]|uniref:Uncharacterized protein n=1 Tax=Austropuccinia psidii MF-1 TaxID=1389203 RepID=A0A9Q3EC97_9BASI|nr:hypothetical protein [Austropuccinia psidii MF-1]
MPVQDSNISHAKPCTGEAFQQSQQFLTPVQALNDPHAKYLPLYRFPTIQIIAYAGEASGQLQHFLMRVQAPSASYANPYACAGSQQFKKIAYTREGFQQFTHKCLCWYRFP